MIRVYAVVEGATEERFLNSVIVPHLADRSVFLQPMQVLRGGGMRGGGQSWQTWERHLKRLMSQEKGTDVRFTSMLDLYAIPKDTPGWTPPGSDAGPQRADRILEAMRDRLPDRRFMPYVQVHEFEALLFVDLTVLARQAPDIVDSGLFEQLQSSVVGVEPEDVDDSPTGAPSKRIEACTRGFRKTIHGIQAVDEIGLSRLRQDCPRFGAWMSALEELSG